MRYLGLLIIFTVSLLSTCHDNIVNSNGADLYFPLQLGNQWTFELTYSDSLLRKEEVTYSIIKRKIIDGKEYFAFDKWPEFIYYPVSHYFNMDSVFIRNGENGNVIMFANGKEFEFIKFDPFLSDSLVNIVELFHEETQWNSIWQSMIYNVNLLLETEQRKIDNGFKIMFWEYNAVGSQRDVLFFPGFGIVRMGYSSYSMDWKLKEALINGKKTEKIISYPNL